MEPLPCAVPQQFPQPFHFGEQFGHPLASSQDEIQVEDDVAGNPGVGQLNPEAMVAVCPKLDVAGHCRYGVDA